MLDHLKRQLSSRLLSLTALGAIAVTSSACASFKLDDAPSGFAVVSSYEGSSGYLRAKARDNVGLNIVTFHNVDGGTLSYWSGDLVDKLGRRGYHMFEQKPVRAKNGVQGTRFDFRYTPPGDLEAGEKFYTAVLYVSDRHRVVVQMGGNWASRDDHVAHVEQVAKTIKVRGCKAGSKICKGPQPPQLRTTAPEEPAKPSPGSDEPVEPPVDPPVEPMPAEPTPEATAAPAAKK